MQKSGLLKASLDKYGPHPTIVQWYSNSWETCGSDCQNSTEKIWSYTLQSITSMLMLIPLVNMIMEDFVWQWDQCFSWFWYFSISNYNDQKIMTCMYTDVWIFLWGQNSLSYMSLCRTGILHEPTSGGLQCHLEHFPLRQTMSIFDFQFFVQSKDDKHSAACHLFFTGLTN